MENKYFIYCRKSSEQEDRQVLSLDSQEKVLRELAVNEHLKVVDILRESGSAHSMGRKLFNEMAVRILKGEANGLIVWDESRIARNAGDGGMVINMFDIGKLVEIRKPGKIYRNTPDDKFFLNLIFSMSKKESDDKGVNVKRGLNTKAEKGWLPSGAKPGYMNDKYAEKGNKTIKIDPDRFPLIQMAWDYFVNKGYPIPKILDLLNNEWGYRSPIKRSIGGKPMCRSQIYLMFRDPFYYGYFEYPTGSGKWRKGSHTPMITKDDFDKAQIILGRNMAPRPHKTVFSYSGLITCGECGARITAEEKWQTVCTNCKTKFTSTNSNVCPNCGTKTEDMINPKIRHYIHYHCTKRKNPNCTQRSIEVKDLEIQIDILLGEIEISKRFTKWALNHLNELNNQEVEQRNDIVNTIQTNYTNCLKRLDNLTTLMISAGNIDRSLLTDEEFKKRKTEILEEKQKLEDQMNNTGKRVEDWLKEVEDKFNFANQARKKFNEPDTTVEEKREMMFRISSDLKLYHRNLDSLLENLYEPLRRITKGDPTTKQEFEPKNILEKYGSLESEWSQNPLVLPALEEIRTYLIGVSM